MIPKEVIEWAIGSISGQGATTFARVAFAGYGGMSDDWSKYIIILTLCEDKKWLTMKFGLARQFLRVQPPNRNPFTDKVIISPIVDEQVKNTLIYYTT